MGIVLDADVIIRSEKSLFDLQAWLKSQSGEQFSLAAITVAELWHGVERATGKHRAKREAYVRGLIAALPILTYTEHTAFIHARLWAELQSSGKTIDAYDMIVAATALEHNCAVATFNRRHFSAIKGLTIVEPA